MTAIETRRPQSGIDAGALMMKTHLHVLPRSGVAAMSIEATSSSAPKQVSPVTLSHWVNEPALAKTEVLSAHDVARLTRRPVWLLVGMAWTGQFPKKLGHRGRRVGWCRSDVLEWLARDLSVVVDKPEPPRRCTRRRQRQACLPPEYQRSCEWALPLAASELKRSKP